MNESIEHQALTNGVIIDAVKDETIDKKGLLELLNAHRIETTAIQDSTTIEQVIPTLRRAKVNLPEDFFKELANKTGFRFLENNKIRKIYESEAKSKLITILPYAIVNKYKLIPTYIDESCLEVAINNPLDKRVMITFQYLFRSRKIKFNVASSAVIEWAIENIYRQIHKQKAILDLYNRSPDQSAFKVLFPNQKYFIISLIVIVATGFILSSAFTGAVLFAIISIGYFIINPIKIYVSLKGFQGSRLPRTGANETTFEVSDKELPVYTVLIPVFNEAEVLARNLRNMYRLNYPREKLDIKILMEEKDLQTINEAKKLGFFGGLPQKNVEGIPDEEYVEFLKLFEPIIIPASEITTKPRACNYGLLRARGEFCVIYDAEDDPDPDQLRKAVKGFLHSNDRVVCLQSKLNFYNADENILSKLFSIEYAYWFDFYLQGLDYINAPIPLGGTSNHFRKKSIDELGRWDPYNVTEDADIGIRLARRKLKTQILESHTLEEAPLKVKSWIRQRSRWQKGHLQTYLVHMRYPKKLLKELGTKQFLKFQLTFGAEIFMPIINPILWILTAASFLAPLFFAGLIPSYVQFICLFNLIVGNLSYLLLDLIACIKLRRYRLTPLTMLMPVYWVLLSIASWRGLIQLIKKPFYWDKTSHGLSKATKSANKQSATLISSQ